MVQPQMISRIVDQAGDDVWSSQPQTKKLLDPRINYMMVSFMQDVLRWGTGARVRARGFTLPAAGKTGTSHDAWFAGFTSKLLCIVWVGLDDYQDIKMQGADAAAPIWTEFMKRAHEHRAYRDVTQFDVPDGLVSAQIDIGTGQLATNVCPLSLVRTEYYLLGTQPVQFCATHMGGSTEVAGWENLPTAPPMAGDAPAMPAQNMPDLRQNEKPKEKKSLLDKLKGIFH
jgi:penicillin-binding protein 1B